MDGLLNPSIPGPNIGATDGAAVQEADVQLLFRLDLPPDGEGRWSCRDPGRELPLKVINMGLYLKLRRNTSLKWLEYTSIGLESSYVC